MQFEHGGHYQKKHVFGACVVFCCLSLWVGLFDIKNTFPSSSLRETCICLALLMWVCLLDWCIFSKLMHNHSKHVFVIQHARKFLMMISIREDRPRWWSWHKNRGKSNVNDFVQCFVPFSHSYVLTTHTKLSCFNASIFVGTLGYRHHTQIVFGLA